MSVHYELCGLDELPTIDLKLTLKMVLLANSPRILRRINTFIHHTKHLFTRITFLSACAQIIGVLVPASLGEIIITPTMVDFIALFFGILSMRYHMIQIVMKTYEFWYILINSIVYSIVGTIQMKNGRSVLMLLTSSASVFLIMMDANFKSGIDVIIMGLIYASIQCFMISLVAFQAIDQFTPFVILAHNEWVLMSDDVLINCLATLMILALRSSYRRYQHYKMATDGKNRVRCITYHARLQFVESRKSIIMRIPKRSAISMHQISVEPGPQIMGHHIESFYPFECGTPTTKAQLMNIPIMNTIDPTYMIGKGLALTSIKPYPHHVQRLCQCVIVVGVTTSLFSIFCLELGDCVLESIIPFSLAIVSFGFTIITYGICHLHRHHAILRKLTRSFDYLFLNFQVISATVVLIFLFDGDARSIIVISSLLWMLWIMTLDTLTPVIKKKFGITPYLMMYVMMIVTLSQFFLVLRVGSYVHDRTIFKFRLKNGRVIEWRAIGFFLSRMFTVCAWCLRLFCRVKGLLKPEHSNALVMLYGSVEYEDVAWMRTRTVVPHNFSSFRRRTMEAAHHRMSDPRVK